MSGTSALCSTFSVRKRGGEEDATAPLTYENR
eukprot:CAMPEP_0175208628 /NCGR_PEP_ID=MMETSP0093-20121207/13718_1 /TAXON_ID=311494 /ORGANISM="Alexandrium monilatum, Strain CCMP3105" /LENGTH=31 /DNA_ID= /DNA_START= /DNA_END= /DNA_ORIENTATION=